MENTLSLLPLSCGVQHYAWGCRLTDGSAPFIAELLGEEAGEQPWAELWMGAHPKLCAAVNGKSLAAVIRENPRAMVGCEVKESQPALPFLLKVLSCSRPLSIQSHPNKAAAERLHRESPDLYPDDNHKPEVIVALTEFELLAEFRPLAEVTHAQGLRTALAEWRKATVDIKSAVTWLSQLSKDQAAAVCTALAEELEADKALLPADRVFLKLSRYYPNDGGTLFAYLLNYCRLKPGQYLNVGADHLHAYLSGTGIECMAASDNVIRAGLTPKPIDWPRLLETADFRSSRPDVRDSVPLPSGGKLFSIDAEEFELEFLDCHNPHRLVEYSGFPGILLVLSGHAAFTVGGETIQAPRGSCWFKPAALQDGVIRMNSRNDVVVWAYSRYRNN